MKKGIVCSDGKALPAWAKGLFLLVGLLCQNLAYKSRLIQDSSHNYVAIVTRGTTGQTQKMYLKKNPWFNRFIVFVKSVDIYLFFCVKLRKF